jgi:uncharacterized protein
MSEHRITALPELLAIYGETNPISLAKETTALTPAYRTMLASARFFTIATSGHGGLDCSPRGDAMGHLIAIEDDTTLLIPDRRGNNRLDTLKNIIADPRIALLFLIPGVNETLRINGSAEISTDPTLIQRFMMDSKPPRTVIKVNITAVYFQCARALARSALWDPASRVDRTTLPTAGQMTQSAKADFDAATYDAALPERQRTTLY